MSSKRKFCQDSVSTAPKRARFSAELARERAREFITCKEALVTAYTEFVKAAELVMNSEQCTSILRDAAMQTLDDQKPVCDISSLCLVSFIGLEGVDCLRIAHHLVPESFFDLRNTYITRIVNSVLPNKPLSSAKCSQLVSLTKTIPFFGRKSTIDGYLKELHSVSMSTGKAHTAFLAPPVMKCIQPDCNSYNIPGSLYVHHKEVDVTVFSTNGPLPATKVSLRCNKCSTNYNYTSYGKKQSRGENLYKECRELIELSDVAYCSRLLSKSFIALCVHSWVSFSGFAESYFDWTSEDLLSRWTQEWAATKHRGYPSELTRAHVSDMFYNTEMEAELRERSHRLEWAWRNDGDREQFMTEVTEEAVSCLYSHEPTPECAQKGCGKCWSVDGNWKLCFTHCMYPVKVTVPGIAVNIPDVCTKEPVNTKTAFCKQHVQVAIQQDCPTDVKGFLKFCGTPSSNLDGPLHEDVEVLQEEVDSDILRDIAKPGPSSLSGTLLDQHPDLLHHVTDDEPSDTPSSCSKDLGGKKRLRHWSRGHVFICRPCGHIDYWKPIYMSESPSQVLLIVLGWLFEVLKEVPKDKWSEVVLAYDAMCKLDGMKVCRKPLPLPEPYDEMWMKITKVVDPFHFPNHTDSVCKKKYNPEVIRKKEEHKDWNMMCAEQTIIVHRNRYTYLCHVSGRKPLLPKTDKHRLKE